jgi:hypothetical protein
MDALIIKTLKGTKKVGGTLRSKPIDFHDVKVRHHYETVLANKEETLSRKEFSDKALDEAIVRR